MKIRSLLGIALLILDVACTTKPPRCTDHFAAGDVPVITSQSLAKQTRTLCFEAYATMHSGVSRTPLWSAEHLTEKNVDAARELKRKNTFHAEPQLPQGERAELSDYARSGFDRGHMAPSGDMPTESAQYESFSLANMIPQNSNNNQNLWEGIESSTRNLARQDGELYVVTGPLFEGQSLQRLNGRVLVPTGVFKAIYDPARKAAAAYVVPNARGMEYQTLSIADLEKRANMNIFPGLPAQIKETKMALPTPTPHGSRGGRNMPVEVE
jgi:endonuclease G